MPRKEVLWQAGEYFTRVSGYFVAALKRERQRAGFRIAAASFYPHSAGSDGCTVLPS